VSVNGPPIDASYELDDRYRLEEGRVYLTGVQALVRLPLLQRQRDAAAGLDTAGFISGYRGSPLGTYDMALWQARPFLDEHRIHFERGVHIEREDRLIDLQARDRQRGPALRALGRRAPGPVLPQRVERPERQLAAAERAAHAQPLHPQRVDAARCDAPEGVLEVESA